MPTQDRKLTVVVGMIVALLLSIDVFILQPAYANPAEAQLEYSAGLMDYKKGSFRSAATHFKASIEKDPQAQSHCLRRLYLAHCYAALKELDKAIPAYQDICNNCFGSPEAKFAKDCMEKLQPKSQVKLGKGILNRITILAPIESAHIARHPAVSSTYIAMVKNTLERLPPTIFKLIDDSNCTITIGPNIVDKWPDSGDELAPGKTTKLSEDHARTYGMEVYLWERPLEDAPEGGGKRQFGPAFTMDEARFSFFTQIGHVVCEIVGANEDPILIDAYNKDCESIPEFMRKNEWVVFYTSQKKMGPGEVAAAVLENILQGRSTPIQEYFSRSTAWVKRKFKV